MSHNHKQHEGSGNLEADAKKQVDSRELLDEQSYEDINHTYRKTSDVQPSNSH